MAQRPFLEVSRSMVRILLTQVYTGSVEDEWVDRNLSASRGFLLTGLSQVLSCGFPWHATAFLAEGDSICSQHCR